MCLFYFFYKESVFSFCSRLRRDTNLHDEPVRHVVFAFQLGLWGWSFFSAGDSGSCDNPLSYHFLWAVYEWQDGWPEHGQRATIVSAPTKSTRSLKEAFKGGRMTFLVLDVAHYLPPFFPQFVRELVDDGAYVGEQIQRVHILCSFHCIVTCTGLNCCCTIGLCDWPFNCLVNVCYCCVDKRFWGSPLFFCRRLYGSPLVYRIKRGNCSALHFALVSTLCSNMSITDK